MRIGIEMAIQFTRIEFLSRSKGGDSCRKAAYNARTIVKNEKTGIKYNFSRKKDNVYHTVLIPDYVNQDFKNIQTLMNEVERTEKRENSQLLKDIVIALPDEKELNLEHRIELTHRIVDAMEWVQKGIGVQIDIHKPQTGDKNWHVHILLTMRRFRKDGTGLGDRAVDLNPKIITVNGKKVVIKDPEMIHERVKEIINAFFAKLGLPYRVKDTSKVPEKHIGPPRIRSLINRHLSKLVKVVQNYNKLNLRPNLLGLFRYLSAIILNYFNQFRKKSNKGIALNELGRHQEAIESCNLAIKYDSDNVYAYQLANELAQKIKKSNLRIITD
ncbi:mobA/MobL family protein [Orientia tsutsugamushi str. Karp]|nr:mobA/MobL family protein [Orientia tsutsugamushi str. Karp]